MPERSTHAVSAPGTPDPVEALTVPPDTSPAPAAAQFLDHPTAPAPPRGLAALIRSWRAEPAAEDLQK